MKPIIDAMVDETDDLILVGDDFYIEENILQNAINIAGRRIVWRYDDSAFRENLCAGLERFLFSKNIYTSAYDITSAIVKCLSRDSLFSSTEYDIKITKSKTEREAKLYIIFRIPLAGDANTFKIFVDTENQRVYRS